MGKLPLPWEPSRCVSTVQFPNMSPNHFSVAAMTKYFSNRNRNHANLAGSGLLAVLSIVSAAPAFAQALESSLVPPDVTLNSASTLASENTASSGFIAADQSAQGNYSQSSGGTSGSTSSTSTSSSSSSNSGLWNAMQEGDIPGPDNPVIGSTGAPISGTTTGSTTSSNSQSGTVRAVQTQAPY